MSEPETLEVTDFWEFLRTFWTEDRVSSWWDAVYGDIVTTKRLANMILLSQDATITTPWDSLRWSLWVRMRMGTRCVFALGGYDRHTLNLIRST